MSENDDDDQAAEDKLRDELAKDAAKVKPSKDALAKINKRTGGDKRGNGKGGRR